MEKTINYGISLESVSRRFDAKWALIRASFEIKPGSCLMLTGPNGSGKTSLLRCLATELRPHYGTISINGQDLWTHRDQFRHHIAFVAHDTRLYDDLSALENLSLLAALRLEPTDPVHWIRHVGLSHVQDQPVREYSAGMRRRLALATALMKNPRLLLLDEPFAALDTEGRTIVASAVDDLKRSGTTVVIATHRPLVAAPSCEHAVHLMDGKIKWMGDAKEALEQGIAT